MNLRQNIKVAIDSVRSNLLRSVLTITIIAFGIMALVGILTAIDAAIFSLNDNFSSLGANSFSIKPKGDGVRGRGRGRRAKEGDPISFKQAMNYKKRFDFPGRTTVSVQGTSLATVRFKKEETNPNIPLIGVDENYLDIKGFDLQIGRNFSISEIENGVHKAIIGNDIVKTLFNKKPERALNKTIAVGNIKYLVIGVLESKGAGMGGSEDRQIFAPLLNIKRYYGSPKSNYDVVTSVTNEEDMEPAVASAIGIFRNIRNLRTIQENDFEISQSDSLIAILRENTSNLRWSAVGIGIITLLGAAIGLMNIMLVSVTERTREIGICKSLGATRKNILIQFLTEATVICQIGGLTGVVLGILVGFGVTAALGGSFFVPWNWIFVGIATCLFVGLVSGLYPALKASRLDPIESLRYE